MKQVLQYLRDGTTEVVDMPSPAVSPGRILIRASRSVISPGTERMLVSFGKANLLEKARQQPEKAWQVLDKVGADGLMTTLEAVRDKLDVPLALGYAQVGTVIAVGEGVGDVAVGDRVASNGRHAEIVSVPANLCARVPDSVTDDQAAFTVLGAVALQGIRLVQPTLGEAVAVIGLGLVGLLTVQLLRSHGCRVLGIDIDPQKVALAQRFGAECVDISAGTDPLAAAAEFSRNRGVDAVIVAASSRGSDPIHQAARMCRQRGRIVLVGVTGLNLMRSDFYGKELTFQVSCSYGPGRYDPAYEEQGHDYPVGFVRWTEQRNFEAVLDMMADGRLDVGPLISHRFPIERAEDAYAVINGEEQALGILLQYSQSKDEFELRAQTLRLNAPAPRGYRAVAVSFLGAGNYANRVLIPAFKAAGAGLRSVASTGGALSYHASRRHGFAQVTTDIGQTIGDPLADAIAIATPHNSHAELTIAALQMGKHVFVEKPLCLGLDELDAVTSAYHGLHEPRLLMVGFNRRFAPHVRKMKALLATVAAPKSFVVTVNAGSVDKEHWVQNKAVGGGRIVGEACHFIDLIRYLVGHPIKAFDCIALPTQTNDSATLQLSFADGSIGTVHYFANGDRRFPKERVEVFCAGRILQLDNFRVLRGFGWPAFRGLRLWRQDKGQRACVTAFIEAIRNGDTSPIPFDEIVEVSRASILLGAP